MNDQNRTNCRLIYTIFSTCAGWIGLLASPEGCLQATFPQKTRDLVTIKLGVNNAVNYMPEYFQEWCAELQSYFNGKNINFSGKIDISGATPFQQSVWTATRSIKYGETQSYNWIALQIGKPLAARAVGQALGRNPLPVIIPCHRVISKDGALGGFGGGLDMKRFLLALESKQYCY